MYLSSDSGTMLDATFGLEERADDFVLTYESRGPGRNTAYAQGLELILSRLQQWSSTITDGWVASAKVSSLPLDARRLQPAGFGYPIDLAAVENLAELRNRFGASAAGIGREPDASGDGNRTKRIQLAVTVPRVVPLDALVQHVSGGGRPSYWALLANPLIYRVEDAVRSLREDNWRTAGRSITTGDRVAVWKAAGGGPTRGIVALGHVVGAPRLLADMDNPFWIDATAAAEEHECVTVEYEVPAGLPLWTGSPGAEFLEHLAVAKARGGSVFELTPPQWMQIMDAVGGWRTPAPEVLDAEEATRSRGRGQGRAQNPAVRRAVEAYAMQRALTYFSARWPVVFDVSRTASFDLLCRNGTAELHVEVKGTRGDGSSVLLTANEVRHARREYPGVALFVTSGVVVTMVGTSAVASGGIDRLFEPWEISRMRLEPVQLECLLPSD